MRRFRLTPQQFWMLVAVHEAERPSLRELAERLRIDAPTASRIVAVLVRRGLVRVGVDREDRRRSHITSTAAGARLRRALCDLADEIGRAVTAGMEPGEEERLRGALLRVIANMDRLEGRDASSPRAGRSRRRE